MEEFSLNRLIASLPNSRAVLICKSLRGEEIISASDMWIDISSVCARMQKLGLRHSDKAILSAANSYDLIVCDLACLALGISTIPIPNGEHAEIRRIASLSEAKVILSDEDIDHLHIPVLAMNHLVTRSVVPSPIALLGNYCGHDDVPVTYKSSSGTTSAQPKYVACSASHIDNLINQIAEPFVFTEEDRLLFFLPISIFLQRCLLYLGLYSNAQIYLTSFENSFHALRQFKPNVIFGAPSFYEALFRSKAITSAIFQKLPPRVLWSGSAGVNPQVAKYFADQGHPLYEGYGMTEIGLIAKASPGHWRLGSVGKVLAGVDIKFDATQQILVKAAHGPEPKYLGGPDEATFPINEQGYIETGDLGFLDEDGFLFITGRVKNTIILNSGNKVMPEFVERRIMANCTDIDNCVVIGDGKPFLAAIIDTSLLPAESLLPLICSTNRGIPDYQRVQRFVVIPGAFSERSGCLTINKKLNRKRVLQAYADAICALYAKDFNTGLRNGVYFGAAINEISITGGN